MKQKANRRWVGDLIIVMFLMTTAAFAQDSLSIGVLGSLPTYQLASNPTPSNNLTIQTNWSINSGSGAGQLYVCVYMNAPMTGTGNNTDTIPANDVQVSPNGTWTSIVTATTSCGVSGALQVASSKIPASRMRGGNETDTVSVRIAGYPANLLPDTYTGTITLIADIQ